MYQNIVQLNFLLFLRSFVILGLCVSVMLGCKPSYPDSIDLNDDDKSERSEPVDTGPLDLTPPAGYYVINQGIYGGLYQLDETNASLVLTARTKDLSEYTARFTDFRAEIILDAGVPSLSQLFVLINPVSLEIDVSENSDWSETLRYGEAWLNANVFPEIFYKSTDIKINGTGPGKDIDDIDGTAVVEGTLSLLNVTKEVPLFVKFNGAELAETPDQHDILDFSATAKLERSDFGLNALSTEIPDTIDITIEAKFKYAQ